MKLIFTILLNLVGFTLSGASTPLKFFTIQEDFDTSGIPECLENNIDFCKKISVDFDSLLSGKRLMFPNDVVMKREFQVDTDSDNTMAYSYKNTNFDSAVLTVILEAAGDTQSLNGDIVYVDGTFYVIQNCGTSCHVLIKEDNPPANETVYGEEKSRYLGPPAPPLPPLPVAGLDRQNTIYTVSLALYYTPAFAATTSNVQGFLQNEVATANVALSNTRLNLRLSIHCIQPIDLREQSTGFNMLRVFKTSRGTVRTLLNTADAAILYTSGALGSTCGQVDAIDPVRSRTLPVAFVGKSCNTFTLAHEMGHLYGVRHDNDPTNTFDTYGHGYNIRNTNYRTIMSTNNNRISINYYSNLIFNIQGNLLGAANTNNAFRTIDNIRQRLSIVGNENNRNCAGGSSNGCEDNGSEADCEFWRSRGYCRRSFVDYMRQNCAKTCSFCSPGGCNNVYSGCNGWASSGFCRNYYVTFMLENCPRACGLCG